MAGAPKTSAFMLGTATVMIGDTDELFGLNPTDHSIGLVKNFQITAEPTYQELTAGVKNTIVYSVLTANPVHCSMEVYEFTGKNLAYGLGLNGSAVASQVTHTLKTAIADGGTAVVVNTPTDPGYATGDWVVIQEAQNDSVHVGQLASAGTFATDTTTLTLTADTTIPETVTFSVGALVSRVNRINVGETANQPFLAAKIVGILPEGNVPVTILMPKIRITKGFTLPFRTDNFGNLPYEFTPYELATTDDNYALFANKGVASLFTTN